MRKAAAFLLILGTGVLVGWCSNQNRQGHLPRPAAVPREITPRGALSSAELSLIEKFKEAKPSVVYITTIAFQQDFFSLDVQAVRTGTGSGFLWDNQGHVVTNYHVVEGVVEDGQEAEITLSDGSKHKAHLVGIAPDKDLAVLRLTNPPAKLRPIPVGCSNDLQVGQSVLAIGNPFGLDLTLTSGIVSALGREIQSVTKRRITGVIQTDAAINPGNSGGPLLDSAGRLIGVNTAIYSPSGANIGIGFAVPVDTVNRTVPQLISKGKIKRPELGFDPLDASYAPAFGSPKGVIVLRVHRGSPADRAGLQGIMRSGRSYLLGDVITGINGKPVKDINDLLDVLETIQDGALSLEVMREGSKVKLSMRIGSPQERL